jgi:hypothetical protein
MKGIIKLAALALLVATTATAGSGYAGNRFLLLIPTDLFPVENDSSAGGEEAKPATAPGVLGASFAISIFDRNIVDGFADAWKHTGNGKYNTEAVILILRMADGSFSAKQQGYTNEYKQFTFAWHPATVAIVHTHPNGVDPEPQYEDIKVSDKYRVPIFTLTSRGMFVYDPYSKKVSRVQDGLDWLKHSKWAGEISLK